MGYKNYDIDNGNKAVYCAGSAAFWFPAEHAVSSSFVKYLGLWITHRILYSALYQEHSSRIIAQFLQIYLSISFLNHNHFILLSPLTSISTCPCFLSTLSVSWYLLAEIIFNNQFEDVFHSTKTKKNMSNQNKLTNVSEPQFYSSVVLLSASHSESVSVSSTSVSSSVCEPVLILTPRPGTLHAGLSLLFLSLSQTLLLSPCLWLGGYPSRCHTKLLSVPLLDFR